ncbi:hypothetical protein ACFP2T_34895 [Plantactinospora solaniradicis]|uniref:DUF3618 domain-containing protein n=1 Tax=Plantactinospora solaniradicis TaxID=1723736 RepID=A0ABW1KKI6_9ACTN
MTSNPSASSTSAGQQSTTETVREVGAQAARAGRDVTGSVKEQGKETIAEASRQARNLFGEARGQLTSQAGEQQRRAAGGLRSLADEMRSMVEQSGQSGPVSELARQSAERIHIAANWLEQREPGDLLTEVRRYAKRNPGPFLVGAALLGVVAGRLTRNLASGGDQHAAVADHRLAEAETAPLSMSTDGRGGADVSIDGLSGTASASQIHPTPGTTPSADEAAVLPGLSPSSPAGARL